MNCFTRLFAKVIGVFFIVLGLSSIVFVGILFPEKFAPTVLRASVEHVVIFTPSDMSSKSSNYDRFVGGEGEPDLEMKTGDKEMNHHFFYIYNVSNPKEFINGDEIPMLNEVGPFGYGIVSRRYNVTFDDDLVSFSSYWFAVPLSPETCETDMKKMEHPDPVKCLTSRDTVITTLNPVFAGTLHDRDLNSMFANLVSRTVKDYIDSLHEVLGGWLSLSGKGSIISMQKSSYNFKFGSDAVFDIFDTIKVANGNSHNNAALILNDAALIAQNGLGSQDSPLNEINKVLNSQSLPPTNHVFADVALLSQFYNKASSFSPLNSAGFTKWEKGHTSGAATLIAICATTTTTNCAQRIFGITSWLLYHSNSPSAKKAQYTDFVTKENSFLCMSMYHCDWNLKTHLSFNGADADAPSQALYEDVFNSQSPISLLSKGGRKLWTGVSKYCQNPSMSCSESVNLQNAYQTALSRAVTVDSTTLTAVKADTGLSSSYLGQICSLAKYSDHLRSHFIFDIFTMAAYKAALINLGVMTPTEAAKIHYMKDLTIHDMATSKFSKVFSKNMLTSPSMPHNWIETDMSMPILKEVLNVLMDPIKSYAFLMRTFSNGTTGHEVNTTATFNDIVSAPTAAFLQTAQGTGTVASVFIDFFHTRMMKEVFIDKHIFCDDLIDCNYAKGGLFTTVTAEQYLFTGYSDPGIVFASQLAADDANYTIGCHHQKYYYKDGKTSGHQEDSNNIFSRSETCAKEPNLDCTYGGISVMDIAAGTTHDWAHYEQSIETKSPYYHMDRNFTIGGNIVSPLAPVFANAFGRTLLDIDYQKHRRCGMDEDCTTVINTGKKKIASIGQVELFHGQSKSMEWPRPVGYAGSVTGQFKPRFMEGLKSEKCPKDIQMFLKTYEHYPFIFGIQNRTIIDFKKDNVDTIDVCRYSMSQESYNAMITFINQNSSVLPPNGMLPLPPGINATKPKASMLSAPSFLWDKAFNNGEEWRKFGGLSPDSERHGNYIDVEQATGMAIRVIQRIGSYTSVQRSALFPKLKESRYSFPTSYLVTYGSMKENDTTIFAKLLNYMKVLPKYTQTGGFVVGGVFLMIGALCLYKGQQKKKAPASDIVKPNAI